MKTDEILKNFQKLSKVQQREVIDKAKKMQFQQKENKNNEHYKTEAANHY